MNAIKEYFSSNLSPTKKEIKALFPTIRNVSNITDHWYHLAATNFGKKIDLHFTDERKLVIYLSKSQFSKEWHTKIISSVEEFESVKELLINFFFAPISHLPEFDTWNDDYKSKDLQKKRNRLIEEGKLQFK